MQPRASLLCFALIALVCFAAMDVAAAEGNANRKLRTLIQKRLSFGSAVPAATSGGKSIQLGHLTITKGAAAGPATTGAAPAPAPALAPAPATAGAGAGAATTAPASGAPAPAQTSAPVSLPRGAPVAGTNDISQALQCQSAFNARGGRDGVTAALGAVCQEGGPSFDALGCCQTVAKLLNSGNLNRCACNNLVYDQLCQEVKVGGLTCESLRPTLVGCGLQC